MRKVALIAEDVRWIVPHEARDADRLCHQSRQRQQRQKEGAAVLPSSVAQRSTDNQRHHNEYASLPAGHPLSTLTWAGGILLHSFPLRVSPSTKPLRGRATGRQRETENTKEGGSTRERESRCTSNEESRMNRKRKACWKPRTALALLKGGKERRLLP